MKVRIHRHIHRRVLFQIIILVVIAIALFVAVGYDAARGDIGILPVIVAAAIGTGVGFVAGRMYRLVWHEDTSKVVMRMDKTGFVLIGLYILFRVLSDQLLSEYFNGAALSAVLFAVLDGILVGRLFSLWRNISRIFKEQGII
jgi:hypothetical protein